MKDNAIRKNVIPLRYYLFISFIEGSSVMVCELLGAKMIAPFYGTSLYVWSSAIGVTLAALAAGYFSGGFLIDRFTGNSFLFAVLATGACFIGIMPITAEYAMEATMSLGVRMGSLVSALIFLLPPLICMGMVSPIIIRLASRDVQHTGRTAGSIYAISTLGGIFTTFFLGFYAIPQWGLTLPTYLTAGILGILPLIYFLRIKKFAALTLLIFFLAVPSLRYLFLPKHHESSVKVLYKSEGLLGQVIVARYQNSAQDSSAQRDILWVNRHPQTFVNVQTGSSLWLYPHIVSCISSMKPIGAKALVLGLGGGSIADEYLRLGFEVDACELDERIAHLSQSSFHLSPKCKIFVDDGRHYIRTVDKKYDLIALDVFTGESIPSHLLTVESFNDIRRILTDDGVMIINFNGFISGAAGLGSRSVIRTLFYSGFDVKFLATSGDEENRNLIILASPSKLDFSVLKAERFNACCPSVVHIPLPLPLSSANEIDLQDAVTLVDDKPSMDVLNVYANEQWRMSSMSEFSWAFKGLDIF